MPPAAPAPVLCPRPLPHGGLGGGSTLGVADYVLTFTFFYGQTSTTYHELGHRLAIHTPPA